MNLITYLTFDGNCLEAMTFYKDCFGGELYTMSFGEAPFESPKEAKDRLIHAKLTIGNGVLMASDTMGGMTLQQGSNFSVCVETTDRKETERLFEALVKGGKVTMALQDTFWDAYFGMLVDRFGIQWMFNCGKEQH